VTKQKNREVEVDLEIDEAPAANVETEAAEAAQPKSVVPEGFVTPLQLAATAGVRGQMIYNYIRQGFIPATRVDGCRSFVITVEDAEAWLDKYQANKVAREAKRQAQLEAQLAGENA
jgi:hypothetical protein